MYSLNWFYGKYAKKFNQILSVTIRAVKKKTDNSDLVLGKPQ